MKKKKDWLFCFCFCCCCFVFVLFCCVWSYANLNSQLIKTVLCPKHAQVLNVRFHEVGLNGCPGNVLVMLFEDFGHSSVVQWAEITKGRELHKELDELVALLVPLDFVRGRFCGSLFFFVGMRLYKSLSNIYIFYFYFFILCLCLLYVNFHFILFYLAMKITYCFRKQVKGVVELSQLGMEKIFCVHNVFGQVRHKRHGSCSVRICAATTLLTSE